MFHIMNHMSRKRGATLDLPTGRSVLYTLHWTKPGSGIRMDGMVFGRVFHGAVLRR